MEAWCVLVCCKFFKESTDTTNMLDDWSSQNPESEELHVYTCCVRSSFSLVSMGSAQRT